ncbi:MAG TPA: hypothetical protein DDW70_02580, partial [Rikenellaceae bacterium]|nr:hypothetical protein [Rikenellaceae bacterium]
GFTALPGGFRGIEGIFDSIGDLGYWWSSSQRYPSNTVWYRELYYYGSGIDRYYIDKDYGFSVRCVRD